MKNTHGTVNPKMVREVILDVKNKKVKIMVSYVQGMMDSILQLQKQIEKEQDNCQHINKVCDGDYQNGKELEEDIFADPFANDVTLPESGTIIECYCTHCLKKWVEIVE